MKTFAAPLAIALSLLLAAPVATDAGKGQQKQQATQKQQGKGGGGGRAGRGGGGGHAAPAKRSAPRAAPQRAAPRRAAKPHRQAPRRAATPQRQAPPRAATPRREAPRRAATPDRRSPSVGRAVRQHKDALRRQERDQRSTTGTAHDVPQPPRGRQRAITGQGQREERALRSREDGELRRLPPGQRATRREEISRVREQRAVTRRQQREERAFRSREDRELRRLPPERRAARREEINRARDRRAIERRQAEPNAVGRPDLAAQRQERAERRALRRQRTGAVTPLAARQGRFAAPYAAQARSRDGWRARRHDYAARRAWRQGIHAAFIPWYGPLFWPYAYADIFFYVFWPYGYEAGYWAYAYDDFIDSLFWGVAGPPEEYVAYAAAPPPRARSATVRRLCQEPGSGVTAWPFGEIERRLELEREQKGLLDDVRAAAGKAVDIFRASCPADSAYPLTPPGRLRAMTARLQATLDAVDTVQPPLERFYNSLSGEQQARFNALGPAGLRRNAEAQAALPDNAEACAQTKPGLTNLPIEQIDAVLVPDGDQRKLLDDLANATDKAVSLLQAACPVETPLTPPGRLAAMRARLQAMIDAANAVRPALDDFYASLSGEQKARFNRLGQQLAKSGG